MTSRRVFWGLSSFEMMAMFRRGLFYSYLSVYLRQFLGLHVTETTLFATLPMVANVLCQTFVWGAISDRTQRRRTFLIIGEVLAALGTVAVWYLHTRAPGKIAAGYVIIFGLTVVEIFWSMSNVGWSALISDIFPLASRSAVMARLESVGGVGRMIGIWIGGLLYDGMGRRYEGWGFEHGALFWVASAVMLVSIGPLMAVPEGGVAAGDPVRPKASGSGSGASTTLLLGLFLMAMVCINFGRNAIAITLPQYLMLDQGLAVSSALLGHIMNTHSLAIILCGLVAARISRRIGDRRLLVAGTLAAIAALVGYSLWVNLAVVFIASFVRGLSEVVIMASAYGLASGLIPAHMRARVFGIFNATFFLGWGVGATLMAGPIIDILLARGWAEVSAYRAAFASAAALTTVGVVLLVLLFKLALKR